MSVMIPEAAGTVARRRTPRFIRAQAETVSQRRIARPRQDELRTVRRAGQGYRRQAETVGREAPFTPANYQGVILAEFLAAVTIIAVLPVISGGSPAAQAKGGISPYDTGDLRQIVAVGAVYFILALLATGNRGRISAWFGGLVLLGIGLGKVSHGQLTAAVKNLAGGGTGQETPALY